MSLPSGPFGSIMADVPWSFLTYGGEQQAATIGQQPYRVTAFDEIAKLPVADVAAPDCALYMWVIDSHLDQALALGDAWGFRFVTCAFVWFKGRNEGQVPGIGMGYWTRKQTEQVWLFTRGRPKRLSKGVEQAMFCRRGGHSDKPDLQYTRIMQLTPGPYLEMFARQTWPGWSSWGDQVGMRDGLFSVPQGVANG